MLTFKMTELIYEHAIFVVLFSSFSDANLLPQTTVVYIGNLIQCSNRNVVHGQSCFSLCPTIRTIPN
jgi:hypothetical protein